MTTLILLAVLAAEPPFQNYDHAWRLDTPGGQLACYALPVRRDTNNRWIYGRFNAKLRRVDDVEYPSPHHTTGLPLRDWQSQFVLRRVGVESRRSVRGEYPVGWSWVESPTYRR